MKNKFTMMLCCFAIAGNAQDMTFNNIHKLVESKKYREAIPQLQEFVKKERRHVSAHYDLANCYVGILNELVKIQNANVQNQNTALWSDKEYKDNLNFWNNGIGVTDSAIIYYKETSELMNIQFLTLDLRYNELYEATKDCGVIQKVKCARNYLAEVIDNYEKTNVSNKSRLFNEEKKYEEFKNKSITKGDVITCSQLENKNEDGGDPTIVKTCLFKTYKTVSTGMPDYKGRYSWEYELYKKENGKYVKVNNSSLFNQNRNQLLSTINQKIQKDYKDFSTAPETKDCFEGVTTHRFTFDQLQIDFNDNKINFNVTFGLGDACMSVDGTTVSFTLDEIQPYINE